MVFYIKIFNYICKTGEKVFFLIDYYSNIIFSLKIDI